MTAVRQCDFVTYCAALVELMPYIFQLDHTNYARWLSVQIEDIRSLEFKEPTVFKDLMNNFVVSKSRNHHSCIGIDQALEQFNAKLKSVGGGLDLLNRADDGNSILRYVVSSPEVIRLTDEYESQQKTGCSSNTIGEHHECYVEFQKTFVKDVNKLTNSVEDSLNPYSNLIPQNMVYLNTGKYMPDSKKLSSSMRSLYADGKKQYTEFVEERLRKCSIPLTMPIKRNNILRPSKCGVNLIAFPSLPIKEDHNLMQDVKSAASNRREEILCALEFEPNDTPQVFVVKGKLFETNKATLLPSLREMAKRTSIQDQDQPIDNEMMILDSQPTKYQFLVDLSMIVNQVQYRKSINVKTVSDFCDSVWEEIFSITGIETFQRIDIVEVIIILITIHLRRLPETRGVPGQQ